jgi:hypothetical protein
VEQLKNGMTYTEHAHKAVFNPSHNTLNHYSNVAHIVIDALACCHGISDANFKCASM